LVVDVCGCYRVLGYCHCGTRKVSDFGRAGFSDPNGFRCTIVDQTSAAAGQLKATSTCSSFAISVTQVVGFAACDISVNWDVTVAARTSGITNVVYLRNLDPDNDQDKSGSYMTKNTIIGLRTTGSKYSFVSATSLMGSDSFFGLFSRDSRSRVRYGGFNNDDPWTRPTSSTRPPPPTALVPPPTAIAPSTSSSASATSAPTPPPSST
jgi:hypothetical protein